MSLKMLASRYIITLAFSISNVYKTNNMLTKQCHQGFLKGVFHLHFQSSQIQSNYSTYSWFPKHIGFLSCKFCLASKTRPGPEIGTERYRLNSHNKQGVAMPYTTILPFSTSRINQHVLPGRLGG